MDLGRISPMDLRLVSNQGVTKMLQRLLALAQKEFIQIRRDHRTLAMMILMPLLFLLLFGYAFSFDVKSITVTVIDNSGTVVGKMVAEAFRSYDKFLITKLDDMSEAGIRDAMYRGKLQMGVIIPPEYATSGNNDPMQVFSDGSNLFAAQAGIRMLTSVLEPAQAKIQKEVAAAALATASHLPQTANVPAPAMPRLIPSLNILYNPDLKSANVMIPALLGLVVMVITTLMTAMGVVKEREYGTMEQLVVTPIKPMELMLGKLLPYLVIGAIDFTVVFIAGKYLFNLTFVGNLPLFLMLSLLLVFTTLAVGLLISTVAQNQQQAMQLAMLTIMPQIILSGLIFPLSSLPKAIQVVGLMLPFTYFVPIAKGMFIKGQGLDILWPQVLVLAGYAVVMVTLASLRFHKRLA